VQTLTITSGFQAINYPGMSSSHRPDVEGAHGVLRSDSTGPVTCWDVPTTMQRPRFGNVLFVVGLVLMGLPVRTVEFPATDCLTENKVDMDLDKMDQRHISFMKFQATIGQELQRKPLNGSLWQDGRLLSTESSWRARVVDLWSHGTIKIEFELRVDDRGRRYVLMQCQTRVLILHSTMHAVIGSESEAKARQFERFSIGSD